MKKEIILRNGSEKGRKRKGEKKKNGYIITMIL